MSKQNHSHGNSGDSKTEINGNPGNPPVDSLEKAEGEAQPNDAERKGAASAPEAEGPEAKPVDWERILRIFASGLTGKSRN